MKKAKLFHLFSKACKESIRRVREGYASASSSCFSNRPHFSNQLHFLLRKSSPEDTKLHTAYQSVPHVQWSTKSPPVPHEIFIAACRRKSCVVRDSSFGVLFLHGHSDTAARRGKGGLGAEYRG